jgi:SAM-dependent methyltransferase
VFLSPRPEFAHGENKRPLSDYLKAEKGLRLQARGILAKLRRPAIKGRLLDVGCAAGFFLSEAEGLGWRVKGVEPEKEYCEYARGHMGLSVDCLAFEDFDSKPGDFDVITMIDVLSHFRSPVSALKKAHALLKENGLLVIVTGNKGDLKKKKQGDEGESGWGSPEHLYHFSEKTLRLLLEKTSFTPERMCVISKMSSALSPDRRFAKSSAIYGFLFRFKNIFYPFYRMIKICVDQTAGILLPRIIKTDSTVVIFARK